MSALLFKKLLLRSQWQRTARRLTFHPRVTVVAGRNETGKSSLITAPYTCFGAVPSQPNRRWSHADVQSLLTFQVHGRELSLFRTDSLSAVFDSTGTLMQVVPKRSGRYWAETFGWDVRLFARGASARLLPGWFLAPFYIDQDVGWRDPWAGFRDVQSYPGSRTDLAESLLGARDATFFEQRETVDALHSRKEELKAREKGLLAVSARFRSRRDPLAFSLNSDEYRKDVEHLLLRCRELEAEREKFRNAYVGLSTRKMELELQLRMADAAAKESRLDHEYAVKLAAEGSIICPTCGATYENSYRERFSIKRDEDSCLSVALDLRDVIGDVTIKLNAAIADYDKAARELESVDEILNRKRGDVNLRDIIANDAHRVAADAIEGELAENRGQVMETERTIRASQAGLDASDRSQRRSQILARFRAFRDEFSDALGLATHTDRGARSNSSLDIGARARTEEGVRGSVLPRALVAYRFAFLQTMAEFTSAVMSPLVIDSPRQQDPDDDQFRNTLKFIRDRAPSQQQLIVALVDPSGVDFGGSVLSLTEPHGALSGAEFRDVSDEMRRYVEQLPLQPMLW